MLPEPFSTWFRSRGWTPYAHQVALLDAAEGSTTLLLAPTGGGKTLAGFLPSLVDLHRAPRRGLHTLYVSPLKALAADIQRNLLGPIAELGLDIRCETRSGDTPATRRARQKKNPPQLLLTTPESLALLLMDPAAPALLAGLRRVIIDEIHALAGGKRGDLLALNLARLRALRPTATLTGLTATVADPGDLAFWLLPGDPGRVRRVSAWDDPALRGAAPEITLLRPSGPVPWAGHAGTFAVPDLLRLIAGHRTTLVFVNTRAQAELLYRSLADASAGAFPLALHHGSLAREERQRTEAAMAEGAYRAIIATSSLDLGIDWGAVDLVVQVGAPKNVARLVQRIGRSNHSLARASRAVLVPANRMEMVEAAAALEAAAAGELDNRFQRAGALDVLAQHVVSACCGAPASPDDLFQEARQAGPYAALAREDFDRVLAFAATGGYALRGYEQFRKLAEDAQGRLVPASPRVARQQRLNVGTIVGDPLLKVRLGGRRSLGEIEERFLQGLKPGQTFLFGGRVLRLVRIRNEEAVVAAGGGAPQIPSYAGGRMALSPALSRRVRAWIADPGRWAALPDEAREWLEWQRRRAVLPGPDELLVESFPRAERRVFTAYPFAGRNAHQTLGLLLTRRMESSGLQPLGFVANDYALAVWSLRPVADAAEAARLLDPELLREDLDGWMAETSVLRRTFRECAVVAGMIDRRQPGRERRSRLVTFSSDMIYDVLRRHEPDHILLKATRLEAARGLTDAERLRAVLEEARGRLRFTPLPRVSPLSIPLLLELGREGVDGAATTALLEEETARLLEEARG